MPSVAVAAARARAAPAVRKRPHNESRYRAYRLIATEFVDGDAYDPHEIAQMLMDLRWDEVPRAFAIALYNAARRGPLRHDLASSFGGLISLSTFQAFASMERLMVQPWILQNWDYFFVATIDGLLLLNQKNSSLRAKVDCFHRTIESVFDMVEYGRKYMSLDSAAESTGVHALLAASASTRGSFVNNGILQIYGELPADAMPEAEKDPATDRDLTLAHVIFVDMVAARILREPNREITTWNHAFGFYVGCEVWRGFAQRCLEYMPHTAHNSNILALEKEIEVAHKQLDERSLLEKQQLNYENAVRLHALGRSSRFQPCATRARRPNVRRLIMDCAPNSPRRHLAVLDDDTNKNTRAASPSPSPRAVSPPSPPARGAREVLALRREHTPEDNLPSRCRGRGHRRTPVETPQRAGLGCHERADDSATRRRRWRRRRRRRRPQASGPQAATARTRRAAAGSSARERRQRGRGRMERRHLEGTVARGC